MNARALAAAVVAVSVGLPILADELRLAPRQIMDLATSENVRLNLGERGIELERGVLYEDDGAAAGYCYGPNEERLAGTVAIKKVLLVEQPDATKAFLLVAPGGELSAEINGRAVALRPAGKAGQYWQKYEFDPATLVAGRNELVLSGGGKIWIARDQDFAAGSKAQKSHPNRSAKSTDGGITWNFDRLGTGGDLDGEYYVRVFLEQPQPRGSLTLPVLDAANLSGSLVAPAVKGASPIHVAAKGSGDLGLQFRTGSTAVVDDKSWTKWQPLASAAGEIPQASRYFQIRIVLASRALQDAARLEGLLITAAADPSSSWHSRLRVVECQNPAIVRASIPFEYEPCDQPRLKTLRAEYKLDDVALGAKSELELISKLAVWSSQRWDKGHLQQQYPPWDAHEILRPAADGSPVGGFCQQYNVVFLQACESFGLIGRAVSIGPGDGQFAGRIRGGHEVVEIWSNQYAKWIYVDGNAAWYFVDDASGIPLSLRELRTRQLAAFAESPAASPPPRLVRLAESRYEWTGLTSWPPFLELRLIPRSDFLEQAAPLPLNQGMRGWFWTGHHVWTDERSPASLLYGHRVSQPQNWDWTLNQAHLSLTAKEVPGELRVEFDTVTPGLDCFLAKLDDQPPKPAAGSFTWTLRPGMNRLEAWPRNRAGREGVRSRVVLDYGGE